MAIKMTSIIFYTNFIANANKVCAGSGGSNDHLPVVSGTWREKKLDVSDDDDGFSKSDENDSYHSTHDAFTIESGNSASSTSGVSSNRQSENGGVNHKGQIGHNHEIVNKILVSREINDAIFKPGKFSFGEKKRKTNDIHLCANSISIDYRLSFKCNGPPKYWHQQDLLDIDLLNEHTKLQTT